LRPQTNDLQLLKVITNPSSRAFIIHYPAIRAAINEGQSTEQKGRMSPFESLFHAALALSREVMQITKA